MTETFDPDAPDYIASLWRTFKDTASRDARDRLILHYSPLVKFVAGRVGAGLPSSVDPADLVSYGVLGLIDAIQKFDLSRELKFETYATPRIRGAIIDELRALDWAPRSVRSRAREMERAVSKLEGQLRRSATEAELAAELQISVEELRAQLTAVGQVSMVALEELLTLSGEKGDKVSLLDTLEDANAPEPGTVMEARETLDELQEAMRSLGERERLVIALYYYEGMTLAQIGKLLGVTESRVSQIQSKAVMSLRARLGPAQDR